MKNDKKKTGERKASNLEEKKPDNENNEAEDNAFPGYPHYPASEDIFSRDRKVDLDPDNLAKTKKNKIIPGERNEKNFYDDMTGEDLDIPGSKADEEENNAGSEDEENNYYSLGGDDHNDLEEDKITKPSKK